MLLKADRRNECALLYLTRKLNWIALPYKKNRPRFHVLRQAATLVSTAWHHLSIRSEIMNLCWHCIGLGYCKKLISRLVSDCELENPHFRDDVRQFARNLNVPAAEWRDYLLELYCHYRGRIVDQNGAETFLNMEEFEVPHVREWCRDWINASPSASGASRLRSESRERIRILASILRASFPEEAFTWGMRADNDNSPPEHKDIY